MTVAVFLRTVIGIASLAACVVASDAGAQQKGKVWRVGFLAATGPGASTNLVAALRESMRKLGYVEGKNLAIEHRWPKASLQEEPGVVKELVDSRPDAIVAWPTPAALALKRATTEIPIVFVGVADPVGTGIVPSLARPGGNITGISNLALDLTAKQVQLLRELIPGVQRVGLVANPTNPAVKLQIVETQRAMQQVGLKPIVLSASTDAEFESAFKRLVAEGAQAVLVSPDSTVIEHGKKIAALALNARLPSFFQREENVEAGGLISYGTSLTDQVHQAAVYLGKIFKGAKPADLPVEQPERIKLVVNVKTAKALGVSIPPDLLTRADAVIQ